ncbi:MAG: cation diffusion facilitator family transporter [Clostridiaceae bacterium]|nr:cation diffusion facilitator family transporter [Clostridiaceae bacterium]
MRTITTGRKKSLICALAAAADLALFSVKLFVAVSSNSISIYVDSLNSLADMLVAVIAVIGFRVALMPADEKHPFGYGKIEEVVNLLLSLVILLTGLAFVYTSLQRLLYPVPVWYMFKYALLIAATAAVKLAMVFGFGAAEEKFNSAILKNMKIDSILDFFISVCIVVSFTLTQKLGYSIDSVMGLVASIIIVISGVKSLISSLGLLIGKSQDEDIERAKALIDEAGLTDAVREIYCHSYGETKVYNLVITADAFHTDGLTDKLQNVFRERLSAQLYIKSGGSENE